MPQITCEEILCVADILALKGDRLLIFNGVCLGTIEARTLPVGPKAKAPTGEAPSIPPGPTPSEILQVFQQGIPYSTQQVADILGIERSNGLVRLRVGNIIRRLLKSGHLKIHQVNKQKHVWVLARP